jgi:hypothetical protein
MTIPGSVDGKTRLVPLAGQLTGEAISINLKDYWLSPTSERLEGFTTKCRLPSPW